MEYSQEIVFEPRRTLFFVYMRARGGGGGSTGGGYTNLPPFLPRFLTAFPSLITVDVPAYLPGLSMVVSSLHDHRSDP